MWAPPWGLSFSGAPDRATTRVRGVVLTWVSGAHNARMPTGTFGGAPYRATKRVRAVPKSVPGTHVVGMFTGTSGGAPYGTKKRARWGQKFEGGGGACRFGYLVELPMGPRSVRGVWRYWRGGRLLQACPLGPSVELPIHRATQRACARCSEIGEGERIMRARAATETFMHAHWDVEIYYIGPRNLGQKEEDSSAGCCSCCSRYR